ncbi:RHOMBOID-like protein 12, mitochondrial isoform X2 [Elaeis guineensis]|uniref:RHOMBOID-like protein 12, mitochondrial isoform X2 n=1 Tax=Elaeis guineensis var. tenera TaxID=51953 RepID=A0A6I9S4X3_ELAGV|nr:RHOMBOID-like protein 12, mitochondrial isoform X2 [Elaeis guineensis]
MRRFLPLKLLLRRKNHNPSNPISLPLQRGLPNSASRSPVFSSSPLPEPHHHPFSRLLSDSLRSWRSGDRLPSGSFDFLASQALAKSAMAKGGLERFFDRGTHLWKVSLQRRRGFDAGRLFSSSRNFWRYLMPTPDGVLLSLIGANVAVFFLWRIADPKFMRNNFMISLDNFKSGRLHTLLTSAFSHSDLDHLVTNMIGLYFFGTNIGRLFGPEFLLKLYLAGALGGSIFFLVHKALIVPSTEGYRQWDHSRIPGLGASAAVNAIILLDVFLFPKNIIYVNLIMPVPAILMGAILIGTDLWRVKKGEGHISGSAHLGGAVVAALVWAGIKKGLI